jgi:hypothetical protein
MVTIYNLKTMIMAISLRVEIFRLTSAMGILVTRGLLLVITCYPLLKDEANGVS